MDKPKMQVSWSGGKDSALALHKILRSGDFEVVGLHTVIEEGSKCVGIHQVSEKLIEAQADMLGLPLNKLYLKKKPLAYERLMKKYYGQLNRQGIDAVLFGDIFLEDLKDFRETLLKDSGLKGIYPLWKGDTQLLVNEFWDSGFITRLCAVDAKYIDSEWVGMELSTTFLAKHSHIDPCGENGEYHSLVVDGPLFKKPLRLNMRERYEQVFEFKVKNKQGHPQTITDKFYFAEFELADKSS